MHSLVNIYVNSNQLNIDGINEEICSLPNLKELNIANNLFETLPLLWTEMWGDIDTKKGIYTGKTESDMTVVKDGDDNLSCTVTVLGNPVLSINESTTASAKKSAQIAI